MIGGGGGDNPGTERFSARLQLFCMGKINIGISYSHVSHRLPQKTNVVMTLW